MPVSISFAKGHFIGINARPSGSLLAVVGHGFASKPDVNPRQEDNLAFTGGHYSGTGTPR